MNWFGLDLDEKERIIIRLLSGEDVQALSVETGITEGFLTIQLRAYRKAGRNALHQENPGVGHRIKLLRVLHGYAREDLAMMLSLKDRDLELIESGISKPGRQVIDGLKDILGATAEEIDPFCPLPLAPTLRYYRESPILQKQKRSRSFREAFHEYVKRMPFTHCFMSRLKHIVLLSAHDQLFVVAYMPFTLSRSEMESWEDVRVVETDIVLVPTNPSEHVELLRNLLQCWRVETRQTLDIDRMIEEYKKEEIRLRKIGRDRLEKGIRYTVGEIMKAHHISAADIEKQLSRKKN
ncbi:MAG TPA: hypothetical protein VLX12_07640 [Syntrophorhabdales bacterium]|nr:hypothetical protein [Syntrophorhabdales bacterium]